MAFCNVWLLQWPWRALWDARFVSRGGGGGGYGFIPIMEMVVSLSVTWQIFKPSYLELNWIMRLIRLHNQPRVTSKHMQSTWLYQGIVDDKSFHIRIIRKRIGGQSYGAFVRVLESIYSNDDVDVMTTIIVVTPTTMKLVLMVMIILILLLNNDEADDHGDHDWSLRRDSERLMMIDYYNNWWWQ